MEFSWAPEHPLLLHGIRARSACSAWRLMRILGRMSELLDGPNVRPARSDAVRNRSAILKTAAAMFATHGQRVDVREIARCAGVGMGTLYRHFPTKDNLLETVLHDHFTEWTDTARAAAASQADPAEALSMFLRDAMERHANHRALVERFAETWDTASGIATCEREMHPVIDDLVSRCHDAGVLRPGVTGEDISLLLVALGRIAQLTATQERPELSHRSLQIMLDGLRPSHQTALSTDPPAKSAPSPED